jgi:hypothetical protein
MRLGDLVTLIVNELVDSIQQTAERAEAARMHVSDIDLDIPALVRLQVDTSDSGDDTQIMVTLPSTRDAPPGRVGRVRIFFEANQPSEEAS